MMTEVVPEPKKEGNGAIRAFGAIIGLVALIAGVYAMVEPMGQRIDFMEEQISELNVEILRHSDCEAHPGALARMATQQEKFAEVETQFKGLREVSDVRLKQLEHEQLVARDWRGAHGLRVEGLNASQWERIKALERAAYREAVEDLP